MPDKPLPRHHRHVFTYTVLRATVNDDHTRPQCRISANHTCRKQIELMCSLFVGKKLSQSLILSGILCRRRILLPQLLDFILEHLVLLVHCSDLPEIRRDRLNLLSDKRGRHLKWSEYCPHSTR